MSFVFLFFGRGVPLFLIEFRRRERRFGELTLGSIFLGASLFGGGGFGESYEGLVGS